MLINDPYFGKIFKKGPEKNPQVKALSEEFRQEILNLAQLVLLD